MGKWRMLLSENKGHDIRVPGTPLKYHWWYRKGTPWNHHIKNNLSKIRAHHLYRNPNQQYHPMDLVSNNRADCKPSLNDVCHWPTLKLQSRFHAVLWLFLNPMIYRCISFCKTVKPINCNYDILTINQSSSSYNYICHRGRRPDPSPRNLGGCPSPDSPLNHWERSNWEFNGTQWSFIVDLPFENGDFLMVILV